VKPESAQGEDREMQTGEWEKSNEKPDDSSADDSDNATVAGKSLLRMFAPSQVKN
jgi:hypothetical protein